MKILFVTHQYLPERADGAVIYTHELIKYLQSYRHDCRVLLMPDSKGWNGRQRMWDGVEIFPSGYAPEEHYRWADRVVCQLDYTPLVFGAAMVYKKPLIHITHSDFKFEQINYSGDVRVIYNSENAKKVLAYEKPSVILHPRVRMFEASGPYRSLYITLINCNDNKGALQFYEIAKQMPNKKFLGVFGTYGDQLESNLPNVTNIEPQPDISSVYAQSRIILMPSKLESYGMVGSEAISVGIPVICTPTPGLKENLGEAGIYVDRENIPNWIEEIRKLDSKKSYLYRSEICINRARVQREQSSREFDAAHKLITG